MALVDSEELLLSEDEEELLLSESLLLFESLLSSESEKKSLSALDSDESLPEEDDEESEASSDLKKFEEDLIHKALSRMESEMRRSRQAKRCRAEGVPEKEQIAYMIGRSIGRCIHDDAKEEPPRAQHLGEIELSDRPVGSKLATHEPPCW